MRALALFARSRRLGWALGTVVAIAASGVFLRARVHHLFAGSGSSIPWLMFLPLLIAVVIALSIRSPLHDLELTAARPLARWRVTTVLVLSLVALAGLAPLAASLDGAHQVTAVVRNLLGLLGLALLGGRMLGGRAAWVPPVVWSMTAASLGDAEGHSPPWDWPVRPDTDFAAFCVGVVLGIAGLVAAASGTREVRAEVE